MNSSLARLPSPEGPGSVSRAPHLPEGFTSTFTSWYVDTGELRQHVVTGGDGPPLLLLVHGWPQTWYAWRLVMPGLAQDFSVVAADQRGCGPSSKPPRGYDTGTLSSAGQAQLHPGTPGRQVLTSVDHHERHSGRTSRYVPVTGR
jgi:hypothetical protein